MTVCPDRSSRASRDVRCRMHAMVLSVLIAVCATGALGASASAESLAPGWQATVRPLPSYLRPGGKGVIQIDLYNVGAAPSTGTATVTDVLPAGIESTGPAGRGGECTGTKVVTCQVGPVGVGVYVPVGFGVKVGVAGTGINHVTVSGGGALSPASISDRITVSSAKPPFGFSDFYGWFSNADGTLDTQAGSHPYEFTVAFDLDTFATLEEESSEAFSLTGGEAKNFTLEAAAGLRG